MELILKYFPNLSEQQKTQFAALYDLYTDWNSKINVISRKDITNLYEHHVLHSLGIAKVINFTPDTQIMDLGTGGGFPGIPLAILFPEVQFHLVDSIGKKVKVATEIANAIGLKNVTFRHCRAEEEKRISRKSEGIRKESRNGECFQIKKEIKTVRRARKGCSLKIASSGTCRFWRFFNSYILYCHPSKKIGLLHAFLPYRSVQTART